MKHDVDDADPLTRERRSPERAPAGPSTRHAVVTSALIAVACALIVLVGAEAAAAADRSGTVGASITPTPTPTPTTGTTHEQQNGERPVERDDLGFLGTVFVVGVGFILVIGATGVVFAGRARRRRDRANTPETETDHSDEA